jgi:NADP-dependent 3-hydroxy acid dehydrogenase YdfG
MAFQVVHSIGAVLPSMLERKSGHILAITSDAGRKVFPGLTLYSAAKHFVEATLRGLRSEVAGCKKQSLVLSVWPVSV